MIVFRIINLCLQSVAWISLAEHFAFRGVAAVGVAGLYHEVVYHAMKQGAVVVTLSGKFGEVVAMSRCVAEETHLDVAECSFDVDKYVFAV